MKLNLSEKMLRKAIKIGGYSLFFLIFSFNCGEKPIPQTPTSGSITVRGSEETLPMMMDQAYEFMDLYTKSKILVLDGGSDFGLASLFIDSAQVAISTRPMTAEERIRADSGGFKVNEFKIAKDGIAIVVNPKNPVQKLTVQQIIDIFNGKINNWAKVGGSNLPIRVCIWDENSGNFSYIKDSILKGEKYAVKTWKFATTEDMIKQIDKEKGAIGMISMARLYKSWDPLVEDTRIKALAIGKIADSAFVNPDEATVHAGAYPFVRYIYAYTPREPKGLDAGFITFLTSNAGQRLLLGNGYVPITIPVKFLKENE